MMGKVKNFITHQHMISKTENILEVHQTLDLMNMETRFIGAQDIDMIHQAPQYLATVSYTHLTLPTNREV